MDYSLFTRSTRVARLPRWLVRLKLNIWLLLVAAAAAVQLVVLLVVVAAVLAVI
jgi:hypothetical protein